MFADTPSATTIITGWIGGGILAAFYFVRKAMRYRRRPPLSQSVQEALAGIANAIKELREVDMPSMERQIRAITLQIRQLDAAIGDRARAQEEMDARLQDHDSRLADHGRRIRRVELRLQAGEDFDGEAGHLG